MNQILITIRTKSMETTAQILNAKQKVVRDISHRVSPLKRRLFKTGFQKLSEFFSIDIKSLHCSCRK